MIDKALIGLLMATLDDEVMDIIVGSRSSREVWLALQERFSSVSSASIMQLKTDLQTIKKGADSIEKYLLRIKHAKDQLSSVGVTMIDEDIVVVTLNGLPEEYPMIKIVIRQRDNSIFFKDLRAQLLAAERDIESQLSLSGSMIAMSARGSVKIHLEFHPEIRSKYYGVHLQGRFTKKLGKPPLKMDNPNMEN
ncbi:hypothetical protein ACLB2K_038284 [Fragaria x ananassa]